MVDTKPGVGASAKLNAYWLTGAGSGWKASPTPYRTLLKQLMKHMPKRVAEGLAAEYFHIAFGRWPGRGH